MCVRHRQVAEATDKHNEHIETPQGAYEGETVRLGTLQAAQGVQARGTQRKQFRVCGSGGGFPWWTLWLIWPLFGLLKGIVLALGTMATALFAALPSLSFSISAFWPIALIVVGVVLLLRQR